MTIRKIISLVLCLSICMSICSSFSLVKAADANLDMLSFTLSDDGEYYKVGAKDTTISGAVVIPASYDGLPVKHIISCGFQECEKITKVTLPDTISRISTNAFSDATALKEINIPVGTKYIGENAFYNCGQLKEIALPDTVTHIGKNAFALTALENVVIPESVIYTDTNNTGGKNLFTAEGLFSECHSLKSVTLPSSITEIGQYAFNCCESLETLTIPESVTKIGDYAFNACKKYASIYLSDYVKYMSVLAFGDMTGADYQIASINFPVGITFIGDNPNGVLIKVNHIFYRGFKKTFDINFKIFDDPTQLADLTYETIHYTCTGEETYTFIKEQTGSCISYGGNLYNCSICGDVLQDKYLNSDDHKYDLDGTCKVCGLGDESLLTFTLSSDEESYYVAAKDKTIAGEIIIPAYYNGLPVTQIAKTGFRDCIGITKVTLPETIVRIGSESFYYATALEEINIPDSVKYLGTSAFNGCEKLKAITIPDSVTHIGEAAFRCTGLESIVIPDSVIYEDVRNTNGTAPFTAKRLFVGCSSLKSVTLPSNIKTIGESAFSWCESLEDFVIPEGVTSIENGAFTACKKMLNIYIPDSVEHMSRFAFSTLTDYPHASISLPAGISLEDNSTANWSLRINHVFYRGTEEQFAETIATIDNPETRSEDESKNFRYETVHYNCTGEETYTLIENTETHCLIISDKIFECSLCGTVTDKIMAARGPHIYGEDGSCTMCALGKTNSNDYLDFVKSSDNSYYGVKCDPEATGAIIIPGEHNGLPVKVINASAFAECSGVTSIIISEGVETIKATAFTGAKKLKAITLPSTIKTIGNESHKVFPSSLKGVFIDDLSAWCNIDFYNSSSNPLQTTGKLYLNGELIEDLVIPEDVKVIKQIAFQHADSIKSVTLNEGIEEIGEYAFSYCQNLTEINIPDVPVKIRKGAFDRCAYYSDTSNWEDDTLYIDNHLIESAGTANEFSVKEGTVTIADYAFCDNGNSINSTMNTLNLPDSLVRIGDYAFYGAFGLNVINFGSGLKYIGDYAFSATIMLGEVVLNEGLEYIGDYAFYDSEFYLLHLPSTYKEFNPTSFFCTEWLEVITCAEDNPYFMAEDNVLFTKDKHTLLLSSYRPGKTGSSTYSVPEETREIEDYAFCLHPTHISIKLHDNIERIGVEAFADTYNTTKINENYVGKYLVHADDTDFVVKEGTLGIADDALHGVTNLNIPKSVKFIGDSLEDVAYLDIESLDAWFRLDLQHHEAREVSLQYSVTVRLNGTPLNKLTTVQIPDDVTTIKSYHFGDCSGLKKLYIPSSVTKIEKNAFYKYNKDLVIYALSGSVGYNYAITNDIAVHTLYIEGISGTGTTIDYVNMLIRTPSYNASDVSDIVKIASDSGSATLGSDYVNGKHIWGTGSSIIVYGDQGREDFTLIVNGDINGDSVCDVIDAAQVIRTVNEQSELSGCYAVAADTNEDDEITIEDYSEIVNLILK